MKRILRYSIPLFAGLYPVLFYYSRNIHETTPLSFVKPLMVSVCMSYLLFALLYTSFQSYKRAAVVASVMYILFSSYGHIAYFIRTITGSDTGVSTDFLVFTWMLVFAGLVISALLSTNKQKTLHAIYRGVSAFFVVVLCFPVFHIVRFSLVRSVSKNNSSTQEAGGKNHDVSDTPDVYYLVFDRYANRSSLQGFFDFDNSEFLTYLREKGFRVYDEAYANYPITDLSLASVLNMQYLDDMVQEAGEDAMYWDYAPIQNRISFHAVGQMLQQYGYTYYHLGARWHGTKHNNMADWNFTSGEHLPISEFTFGLLETTILDPFLPGLISFLDTDAQSVLDAREVDRQDRLAHFQKIEEIAEIPGKKFVFAHIILPHPDFLFDRFGNAVSQVEEERGNIRALYVDQLIYTNTLIHTLVDDLMEKTKGEAIIILQSDEGPYPWDGNRNLAIYQDFNWRDMTDEQIRVKFGILQAWYLPGNPEIDVSLMSSSVNTFRYLFNTYFQGTYDYLPHKHYRILHKYHLYKHIDVTNIIRNSSAR